MGRHGGGGRWQEQARAWQQGGPQEGQQQEQRQQQEQQQPERPQNRQQKACFLGSWRHLQKTGKGNNSSEVGHEAG